MRWLISALLLPFLTTAQPSLNYAGKIGLSFNFGTEVNRIGFLLGGYIHYERVQLTTTGRWYYYFKGFVPKKGKEIQVNTSLLIGFGERIEEEKLRNFNELTNQTPYNNSFVYGWNFYKDSHQNNQRTGVIALQINRWQIITENDAFSFIANDRYRTAAAQLRFYLNAEVYLALNTILWTGDPFYETMNVITDENYPSPKGYKDIEGAKFGEYSHGILSLKAGYSLPFSQFAEGQIGINSEKVRHWFQNKIIHDLPFLPNSWNSIRHPHIPMLDSEGQPFVYKEGQEIKNSVFFGDFGLNSSVFY